MRKIFWAVVVLGLVIAGVIFWFRRRGQVSSIRYSQRGQVSFTGDLTPSLDALKEQMLADLGKAEPAPRTLPIPVLKETKRKPRRVKPAPPPKLDARALGRKKRETLPMAVVLWDGVAVISDAAGRQVL